MEEIVRHKGTVLSTSDTHVRVKIVQQSACATCQISSHCQVSESKEKIIDVFDVQSTTYQAGDSVVVYTTRRMAFQALFLGFILPLLLLLIILSLLLWQHTSEGLASLLSLSVLVPYYGILWLYRKKVANFATFYIEHT